MEKEDARSLRDLNMRIYPFSAIVGQEDLKKALILNVINPSIGGVLIRGEKGTAKSTAVRALSMLLPEIKVVTLPLNATEDQVVGGIDFEKTIKTGKCSFHPGILAKANRGILYIDEVNLLDDHIADLIISAAETGINRVEREGISFSHPSRFILVGTMNPEEGDIRPQLLDRFGLCVEVKGIKDIKERVEVIRRREEFDNDPEGFIKRFEEEENLLSQKIIYARKILPEVKVADHIRKMISTICLENNVAGHRADIVMEQAAKALAAFNKRLYVTVEDVKEVASMVLLHRKREISSQKEKEEPELKKKPEYRRKEKESFSKKEDSYKSKFEERREKDGEDQKIPNYQDILDKVFEIGETSKVRKIFAPKDRILRRGSGRRSKTNTEQKRGRYVRATISGGSDIAIDATLRAAAPYQIRRNSPELAVCITGQDIRYKLREGKIKNLLLFLVDASGSMGAQGRMEATKGAIMSLLLDAYQKRDCVAMVSFRKDKAEVRLPPTSSVELAARLLREFPIGGRTPLSAGLIKAYEVIKTSLIKDRNIRPILIIVTDGKANVSIDKSKRPTEEAMLIAKRISEEKHIYPIVVDTEKGGLFQFGIAYKLAKAINASYFHIEDLKAESLVNIVKEVIR